MENFTEREFGQYSLAVHWEEMEICSLNSYKLWDGDFF